MSEQPERIGNLEVSAVFAADYERLRDAASRSLFIGRPLAELSKDDLLFIIGWFAEGEDKEYAALGFCTGYLRGLLKRAG